ncbi:hypothetical protein SBI_07041 [Streptomyces bingchenggensis BCW-1]|uniref:Uncharacterized protein n=1 Tax=Streptomyces bingchenggensis (strain BCW-1) TaxID=749414 RepID=D7C3D6_STRBB|nr:hypothetical protein SBI_07041 [Streptomyces bingchenggensis BCW-1]
MTAITAFLPTVERHTEPMRDGLRAGFRGGSGRCRGPFWAARSGSVRVASAM